MASAAHAADPSDRRALMLSGRTLTRMSGIYAIGSAVAVPVSIASLAVTTRYLSVAEFGRLAALIALAGLITFIANLGSLQGTLIRVYGAAGEGGDDGDAGGVDVISDELLVGSAQEGRRLLASGLLVTLLASAMVSVGALALLSSIGSGLLRTDDLVAVRLAILAGATGAVWRLAQQVYRMERRPVAHSVLGTARPLLMIVLTVGALVQGWGVHGVLGATALANVLACLIAVGSARSYYRLRPRARDVFHIYGPGLRFAPIVLVSFALTHVHVLLLTQLSSAKEVGLYTVASRIAQVPIYFSSAYLMAWAPLELSPIFQAAIARRGRPAFSGTLFTYLALLNLVMLVGLTLGGSLLIQIAAPRFEPAARLIPFTAAALMAHITFYALFRASRFPLRRTVFVVLSLLALGTYSGLAVVLVPRFGTYALAVASAGASIVATAALLGIDRLSGGTVDVPGRRLAGAAVLAVAVVAAAGLSRRLGSDVAAVLELAGIVLYPALLVALRIVPRERLDDLRVIARELLPWAADRRAILRRWPSLSEHERPAVVLLVRDGREAAAVAEYVDAPEAVLKARFVRGLRQLAGAGPASPVDHRVGSYLLSAAPNFERDREARRLAELGASAEDLHELELAYRSLRRLPASHWRRLCGDDLHPARI